MITTALVTISTRASLKRYHTYTLTLGLGEHGDEWDFQRIGTASEKSSVEKELAELRERLERVEEWKQRRNEIEKELGQVWVEGGGDPLALPPYEEGSTVDVGKEREWQRRREERERENEVAVEDSS